MCVDVKMKKIYTLIFLTGCLPQINEEDSVDSANCQFYYNNGVRMVPPECVDTLIPSCQLTQVNAITGIKHFTCQTDNKYYSVLSECNDLVTLNNGTVIRTCIDLSELPKDRWYLCSSFGGLYVEYTNRWAWLELNSDPRACLEEYNWFTGIELK